MARRIPATSRTEPWLLLLWCHLSQILAGGLLKSLAVFLDDILCEFDASVALIGWMFSLEALFFGITCPCASFGTKRLGPRLVMVAGGAITGGGILVASLSHNIFLFGAGISVISGIGSSMVYVAALVTVRRNFRAHYAVANGLTLAGLSVAVFIFPPVIQILITYYGWRGVLFILSALSLNASVTGYLMKDAHGEWKRRFSTRNGTEPQLFEQVAFDDEWQKGDGVTSRTHCDKHGLDPESSVVDTEISSELSSDDQCDKCHNKSMNEDPSEKNLHTIYKEDSRNIETALLRSRSARECEAKNKCMALLADNLLFGMQTVAVFLWSASNTAIMKYLTAAGVQRGLTSIQGAMLLSVTGISQCVGLFTNGIVVSRGMVTALQLYLVVFVLMAASELGLAFVQNYAFGLTMAALFGLSTGTVASLNLVVQRTLHLRAGVQAAGWLMLLEGLAGCIGGLFVGIVCDISGSYTLSFITTSVMTSLGALIVVAIMLIRRVKLGGGKLVDVIAV